jgi:hypothetical protein
VEEPVKILETLGVCMAVFALVFYVAFMLTAASLLVMLLMLAALLCVPAVAVFGKVR